MDRIASNAFVDPSLIGSFRNNFLKKNTELYTFVSGIDKSISEDTTVILQQIPDYIQNINKKIISIIQYKKALEELLEVVTTEYKRKNKKINLPT
jgi:Fic family protein